MTNSAASCSSASPTRSASRRRAGEGIDELRDRIERAFEETLREVELLVPYEQGGRLSELYELAGNVERRERADGVRVSARIPAALTHRFAEFAVGPDGAPTDAA